MPIYYDAGNHIPGINSITKTATDLRLRDFLLSRNIQNPNKYPQLSTSINGSPRGGEPVLDTMVGNGSIVNHPSVGITGIQQYKNAVKQNMFTDTGVSVPSLTNINDITKIPIFPTPPNNSLNYKQEDLSKFGILAKSDSKNYRKDSTLRNLYIDTAKQVDVADTVSLQPIKASSQFKGGYLDEHGGLNLGQGEATRAADILGSILNGQGIGFGGDASIVSNFDIRSSIAGRALNAAGVLKDTRLGLIGAHQLAIALGNNAAFNVQQDLLGKLNIQDNILSLVKNGELSGFRPNYSITVPSSTGGKILTYTEKILGFNVPHSYLDESGSIFSSENGNITNIQRANAMLMNTGNGQIKALTTNILANIGLDNKIDGPDKSPFRNGYTPGYLNHKKERLVNPIGYAFMDSQGDIYNFIGSIRTGSTIPEISWNREKLVQDAGFIDPSLGDYQVKWANNGGSSAFRTDFSWTTKNGNAVNIVSNENQFTGSDWNTSFTDKDVKKSLLVKTQKLFNDRGMKTLVSVKGDKAEKSQIQSAISLNGFISKGSGVLSSSNFHPNGEVNTSQETAENTFCRAWTPYNRYDSVDKLIRHRGLDQQEESGASFYTSGSKPSGWRLNKEGSVLDDNSNGFVKIGPYKDDYHETENGRKGTSPKKYMFSIENLAWGDTDSLLNLLPEEKGPGDLLTGTYGRIMWFPPYDINFSETSSVNLESTNFIGRGEPIYTYNNTERTGNLSFKIIVDHASVMNSFAGDSNVSDEFIDSFIAGCTDLDSSWLDKLTGAERDMIETTTSIPVEKKAIPKITPPSNFSIYFPNDVTEVNTILGDLQYELLPPGTENNITYLGEPQYKSSTNKTPEPSRNFTDNMSFGLNLGPISIGDDIYIDGWSSKPYQDALKAFFKDTCPTCKITVRGSASNQVNTTYANEQLAINRAVNVAGYLVNVVGLPDKNVIVDFKGSIPSKSTEYTEKTPNTNKKVKKDRYASVTFEVMLEKTDDKNTKKEYKKVTTSKLNDVIKRRFYTEVNFFERMKENDPFIFDKIRDKIKYFHPAFHSTTPEGLNSRLTFLLQCTKAGKTNLNDNPKNLAFGRQPVCILRVGDFYNTKIMMDNVSFDFEPLVWDLNPEGIGVQPMIANVTISFKFIGASSLYGPINKLQNALSFNYFANAQVYDPRADYIVYKTANFDMTKDAEYKLQTGLSTISNTLATEVITDPSSPSDVDQEVTLRKNTDNMHGLSDIERLKLVDLTANTTNWIFTIQRKDASDTKPLTQNEYHLPVAITDGVNTYNITGPASPNKLSGTDASPQTFSLNFSLLNPAFTGITPSTKYEFVTNVSNIGEFKNTYSGGTTVSASSISNSTVINETINYENTVNKNTDGGYFYDDIHGAASSGRITNHFSTQVGSALKKYKQPVSVNNVVMQTIYNSTTKNATTKLTGIIGNSPNNNLNYQHFDARGSIARIEDKIKTYARFNSQHNKIMEQFKSQNIMKIGNTHEVTIDIDGQKYLYYEAFYQWTD